MKEFAANLEQAKQDYNALVERKTALTAERQDGIVMYEDAYERIQLGEEKEVEEERERIRAENERRITETVSRIYGDSFDPAILSDAEKETDLDLVMDRRVYEYRKRLYELKRSRILERRREHGER